MIPWDLEQGKACFHFFKYNVSYYNNEESSYLIYFSGYAINSPL